VSDAFRAQELLKEGIAAAKAGDKDHARRALREALALEPDSEATWLWLAGVAESPAEALRHLERVLALNPGHERAAAAARSARLQAGIAAAQADDRARARALLRRVLDDDPDSEAAWLWLASVAANAEESAACLEQALRINPVNERAAASLARYHVRQRQPTGDEATRPTRPPRRRRRRHARRCWSSATAPRPAPTWRRPWRRAATRRCWRRTATRPSTCCGRATCRG
jgi:Tfp pilus assembly protein PilF